MAAPTTVNNLKRRGLKNMGVFCLIIMASPPSGILCAPWDAKVNEIKNDENPLWDNFNLS
jgi:hypothetical protein